MRELSPSMTEHLKSGATTLAFCWIIRRKDGHALGFTDHDKALHIEAVDCEPASGFTASQSRESADFSANDQDIAGALSSDWLRESELMDGLFNDASIETWRVNWQSPQDRLLLRRGCLGEITRNDQHFSAVIRRITAKMDQQQGRLYQSGCDAHLGDERCGLNIQDPKWQRKAWIVSLETTSRLSFEMESEEEQATSDFFSGGFFYIQSGKAVGRQIDILKHTQIATGGQLESWAPLPLDLSVGDEITLTVGCDRRFSTCRRKFDNHVNFRGFPHIPGNDFLMGYPGRSNRNDGSALYEEEDLT
jgi:uncharacterized phage protein (TIGR02218 family)